MLKYVLGIRDVLERGYGGCGGIGIIKFWK